MRIDDLSSLLEHFVRKVVFGGMPLTYMASAMKEFVLSVLTSRTEQSGQALDIGLLSKKTVSSQSLTSEPLIKYTKYYWSIAVLKRRERSWNMREKKPNDNC